MTPCVQVATAVGIAMGPVGANWINITDWTSDDPSMEGHIIYTVMRIVLGIQVLFTGIALPKAYLKRAWRSLTVMVCETLIIVVPHILICAFHYIAAASNDKHVVSQYHIKIMDVALNLWLSTYLRLISGLIIWGLVDSLTFAESLVIAACLAPTDPVLANSVVKGKL